MVVCTVPGIHICRASILCIQLPQRLLQLFGVPQRDCKVVCLELVLPAHDVAQQAQHLCTQQCMCIAAMQRLLQTCSGFACTRGMRQCRQAKCQPVTASCMDASCKTSSNCEALLFLLSQSRSLYTCECKRGDFWNLPLRAVQR